MGHQVADGVVLCRNVLGQEGSNGLLGMFGVRRNRNVFFILTVVMAEVVAVVVIIAQAFEVVIAFGQRVGLRLWIHI